LRAAGDLDRLQPQRFQPFGNRRNIEAGMNRIAGTGVNSSNAWVGRLAPARPSPTRAGVRCRKSRNDPGCVM